MLKIIKYTISQIERGLSLIPENLRCNACGKLLFKYNPLTGFNKMAKIRIEIKCDRCKSLNLFNLIF